MFELQQLASKLVNHLYQVYLLISLQDLQLFIASSLHHFNANHREFKHQIYFS